MKDSIRKRLKRAFALVSSLAMMGSFLDITGASDILSYNVISATATDDEDEDKGGTNETITTTPNEDEGKCSKIDIEISNQLSFDKSVTCYVKVFKINVEDNSSLTPILSEEVILDGNKGKGKVATDYLENGGEYLVEITADGFEKFTQKISEFDNMLCTLKVTLGFDDKYTYVETHLMENDKEVLKEDGTPIIKDTGKNHPGVMRVGDVNGDGNITERDEEILVAAIDSSLKNDGKIDLSLHDIELKEDEKVYSDLNLDGVTNLVDLKFFTRFYVEEADKNREASLTKELSDKYMERMDKTLKEATFTGETKGNVTLADILKKPEPTKPTESNENTESTEKDKKAEEKPVLELQSGKTEIVDGVSKPAEITETNPVGFSVDFQDEPLKEVNLSTNAETGSIFIVDENNKEIEYKFGYDEVHYITEEELAEAITSTAPENTTETIESIETTESTESTESTEPTETTESTESTDTETTESTENTTTTTTEPDKDTEPPTNPVLPKQSEVKVKIDEQGNISLDLGEQVAVKKITLKITKVKDTNLAKIGTVEFLNGMEERIAEPEIDYPTNVKVVQSAVDDKDAKIIATWDKPKNSSGIKYEFEVSTNSATKADGSFASTISGVQNTVVTEPTFFLQSEHGNFKLIKINTTYYVHVRSIDDEGYKSKWSDYAKVTTVSRNRPDKPDYVKATGSFRSMSVTWGSDNTNSTEGYKLYYRPLTETLDSNDNPLDENGNVIPFKEINVGKRTNWNLTDLEDKTTYQVYVQGYNKIGTSEKSVYAQGKTTSSDPVLIRKYNAINCSDTGVLDNSHIVSVRMAGGGEIVGNNIDDMESDGKTAWSVVDGNPETYYKFSRWCDDGLIFEFDQEYEFNSFAMVAPYDGPNFFQMSVTAYNESTGKWYNVCSGWASEGRVKDKNGKQYYIKNIPRTKTRKVKISFANYCANFPEITYSEIVFYHYDPLMDDIMNLYADDLHTVLKDNVTQEMIDELRDKIVLPDKRNGEYHPNKDTLSRELDTAETILNAGHIGDPVLVHTDITTHDPIESGTSRRYSGYNAWQPLGVTAGANTEITVYVGGWSNYNKNFLRTGDNTELKLIVTQYNSESNGLILLNKDLKIGANTFTIPAGTISGAEGGGALYVQYSSGDPKKAYYSIRVEGGTQVPKLDIYQVTDYVEKLNRAADYIEALETYVAGMEEEHNRVHKGSKYFGERNTSLDYSYKKELCIAGATDILDDTMMYSLPAHQILAGLGNGTVEARAVKLIKSMDAMEDMMKLFYQHKGMSNDAEKVVNKIPNQHLNIRYQRMFQGAFMYAAGNHIGIQWGSAPDMVACNGVQADENGRYQSGSYFGWGIAHEIGHCLNDSSYTVAEITNNYFSMLAQSQDKNAGSRLNYNNIFKKVTSNTKGQADQGTQLGMYWQLHLAFDKDFNFKTYNTNSEILDNLFYARMDTYSRNPAKAPKPYNIPLTLSGGTDQQLMRLACAAAEKDILEFFRRWGKTPDATTIEYASQFNHETRAIMYANEDSRVYAMEDESWLINDDGSPATVIDDVQISVGRGSKANKVNISIDVSDDMYEPDILGYEIVRCTISGGDVKETPIAFTRTPNYTDTVTSLNNRTVSYKVTLIDQYLNRSAVFTTDMIKIEHDGSLDKSNWTASVDTTGKHYFTSEIITHEAEEDGVSCHQTVIDPIVNAFDDDLNTTYEATFTEFPSIYINFNQPLEVSGLKYTAGNNSATDKIGYFIYVKDEANNWKHVATGDFSGTGSSIAYFANADGKYLSTYETTEIRLQFTNKTGKSVSIAEIDVLGVTGDNVDFRRDGEKGATAFGILSEDYKYGKREQDYIPKDSVVFVGSYKGNPAYNAVILFDENGNIVGSNGVDDDGESNQIILADVPDGKLITDVSDGTFVYWIDPEDVENMLWPEQVRVELYRFNNAQTMEGQRMVSDSLFEAVPDRSEMAPIKLGGNKKYTTEE